MALVLLWKAHDQIYPPGKGKDGPEPKSWKTHGEPRPVCTPTQESWTKQQVYRELALQKSCSDHASITSWGELNSPASALHPHWLLSPCFPWDPLGYRNSSGEKNQGSAAENKP